MLRLAQRLRIHSSLRALAAHSGAPTAAAGGSVRRFSSSAGASSSASAAAAALLAKSEELRAKLLKQRWTDNEGLGFLIDDSEAAIGEFQKLYKGAGSESEEDKKLYAAFHDLYETKEAARITDHLGDQAKDIMRLNLSSTGVLGLHVKARGELEARTKAALEDYAGFLGRVRGAGVGRKVEEELGRRMLLLRQNVNWRGFSGEFRPVACDHLVMKK